jgi:hypothetical protein
LNDDKPEARSRKRDRLLRSGAGKSTVALHKLRKQNTHTHTHSLSFSLSRLRLYGHEHQHYKLKDAFFADGCILLVEETKDTNENKSPVITWMK